MRAPGIRILLSSRLVLSCSVWTQSQQLLCGILVPWAGWGLLVAPWPLHPCGVACAPGSSVGPHCEGLAVVGALLSLGPRDTASASSSLPGTVMQPMAHGVGLHSMHLPRTVMTWACCTCFLWVWVLLSSCNVYFMWDSRKFWGRCCFPRIFVLMLSLSHL